MCINEGDLVKVTNRESCFFFYALYVSKGVDGHILEIGDHVQMFEFNDWEVEKIDTREDWERTVSL